MNYQYMYEQFCRDNIGQLKIVSLKCSDVRRFYNKLIDERCLKINTVDNIHTVLHQVLDLAVEDGYFRNNISDNALKESKQARNLFTEKRKALTVQKQDLFVDFFKNNIQYNHWYMIFTLMLGTGFCVGEATKLRWEDVDFENNTININHTLIYYNHAEGGCYCRVNTPKTKVGERSILIIESVKEVLEKEREYQRLTGIECTARVDGFTNFIFVNVQHQGILNKTLCRIIRDCNQEVLDNAKDNENVILLSKFSCHTFTTHLCESGINIKVIQSVLGYSGINTILDIYADVTRNMKKAEMENFEDFMQKKKDAD